MFSWRKSISEICSAIFKHDRIKVYNIEFVPKEYLYESMQHNIRTTLKGLALKDKGVIERPTLILSGFRDVLYAYQTVESYVNINLSDIVRDVMLSEFTDDTHGGAGDPVLSVRDMMANVEAPAQPASPTASGESKTVVEPPVGPAIVGNGIIHQIAQWYCQLFSRDLGVELGISFSPMKKTFVSRPVAAKPGATPEIILDAEWYTDVNELRALATLAGPYGMRVLDRGLLSIVSKHVSQIRDHMVRNQGWLQGLAGRFTEYQLWSETVAKLTGMNELLTHATIVGCVLQFRHLLREALRDVVSEKAPFVFSSVKLAHQHLHDVSDVDPAWASMDYLAQDCGLPVGEADHSLRIALQKLKTQPSDVLTWNLLPEIFGMSYVSPRWNTALYQINTEGHTNNIHCVAETMKALMVAFQRMPLKQEQNKAEVTLRIQGNINLFYLKRQSLLTIIVLINCAVGLLVMCMCRRL
jgi:NCK-associated protein 1